jgi:hypothetical protein
MKKLIVLMVFVLLFSITILAGDLSKEEIVNELKKITIVANKDIRLEISELAEKATKAEFPKEEELYDSVLSS